MVDLSRIVSVVEIDGVRLCESYCRSAVSPAELAEAIRVKTSRDAVIVKAPGDDGSLQIEVAFSLEVRSRSDEGELQAEVRGTFGLSYQIPTDESFSSEELTAFAETNSVLNAWPYWRELVQASLARMSMPTLTMPVFRFSPGDNAEDPAEDSERDDDGDTRDPS